MWAISKKKRVINVVKSYISNYDTNDLIQKPIPNDDKLKFSIRSNLKNIIESVNNLDRQASTKTQQIDLSKLIKSDSLTIPSSQLLSYMKVSKESYDENHSNNNKFSKYFGFIGSALFGYFAVKLKKSKNESDKVKRNEHSDEISNTINTFINRNILKNRVTTISYAANNPIEDRYNAIQLKNLDGYLVEVLDGHGGYQVAEYASKKLHIFFDEKIKELKDEGILSKDDMIISAINYAFTAVEKDILQTAKDAFDKGFGDFIFIGACALVIIVHDNKLYVANCGDSKAKLFIKDGGEYVPIKLTNTLNAGSKKEQLRLRTEYKDEDIFICKRNSPKACYVKGRLQPTRVK